MKKLHRQLTLAALCLGSTLLGACGSNPGGARTSTPTATLGTDSAATKVGGLPDSLRAGAPGNSPR